MSINNPKYNSTPPTLANGQEGQLQVDANGNLKTTGSTTASGGGALLTEDGPYLYSRKTADGQVKATAGFIHTVTISPLTATPTAGLLTIYDSATETGTVIYAEWVFATAVGHTVTLDVPFATACFVGFDGSLANVAVTVSYR